MASGGVETKSDAESSTSAVSAYLHLHLHLPDLAPLVGCINMQLPFFCQFCQAVSGRCAADARHRHDQDGNLPALGGFGFGFGFSFSFGFSFGFRREWWVRSKTSTTAQPTDHLVQYHQFPSLSFDRRKV